MDYNNIVQLDSPPVDFPPNNLPEDEYAQEHLIIDMLRQGRLGHQIKNQYRTLNADGWSCQ